MKLILSLFLVTLSLCGVLSSPAPNARENQTTPLWINIPVPPADIASLVPYPLVPDKYSDGNAYITILTYSLDKLDFYGGNWFGHDWWINTWTSGWVTKFTILVYDPVHDLHGYMIQTIDFENNLSGAIRSAGAVLQQKIWSHTCTYGHSYDAQSTQLSFSFSCSYKDLQQKQWNDGFSGSSAYTKGAGNGIDNDFVRWIAQRNTKYLLQNDGKTVVYADVTYPEITAGLTNYYPLTASSTWTASVLQSRFHLDPTKNYPICQETGKCFWADYYGLIDHANTRITANINDVAADGSVMAPDTMTSTTTTSNNMIWLYGILIGVGTSMLLVTMVFVAMRLRARSQKSVAAVTQHVEMS